MKKSFLVIRTLGTYVVWIAGVPLLMLICGILACLPARLRYDNRLYFVVSTFISHFIIRAAGIKIAISGRENLPRYPQSPAIFVMNHSSALDIPLVEIVAGTYPHIWLSKASYGTIPLFGFLLRRMHVLVDTTSRKDAGAALIKTYGLLKNTSRHALIFPEGTRSVDGNIGNFFSGFSLLAKKLNRPVIPVVISGIHMVYPKNSLIIDSLATTVTITIGKPLFYPPSLSSDEFAVNVHHYFKDTLAHAGR
ncbi:MAG: lysophospholipid acyltransferase family protein [Candidatus Babeliales bacterium]|jgi:1-acyl-sn-glycerol-3-phosphate acyltransferase